MNFGKYFVDHTKSDSFVNKLRKKRFSLLENRIKYLALKKEKIDILDIGGDISFWKHVGWKSEKCHICLLNLYENKIEEKDSPNFHTIVGNALSLPFQKGQFDLIFSNSVIEHVGSKKNQQIFAEEVKRVSDKYIIQTPSLWFPLEPHSLIPFFQFIPHRLRALLIMNFNINYFPKKSSYKEALEVSKSTLMFSKKEFRKLFPDAEIQVERLFGLPKSYTAIKL
jgi:hypothetical protein